MTIEWVWTAGLFIGLQVKEAKEVRSCVCSLKYILIRFPNRRLGSARRQWQPEEVHGNMQVAWRRHQGKDLPPVYYSWYVESGFGPNLSARCWYFTTIRTWSGLIQILLYVDCSPFDIVAVSHLAQETGHHSGALWWVRLCLDVFHWIRSLQQIHEKFGGENEHVAVWAQPKRESCPSGKFFNNVNRMY